MARYTITALMTVELTDEEADRLPNAQAVASEFQQRATIGGTGNGLLLVHVYPGAYIPGAADIKAHRECRGGSQQ